METSLCVCAGLCLLASIWGEAEKSLPLSRQKPKSPADPWMTHNPTHTQTHSSGSLKHGGNGTREFLLFSVDPCAKSSQHIYVCVSIRATDGTVKTPALALPELQKWSALPDPLQTITHSVSERRVGCISWTWD